MNLDRTTDANGNAIWTVSHTTTAKDVLDFYDKITANLAQLQTDAGVATTPPPVDPPPVTPPPVTTGFRGIFAFNNMSNTALFSDNANVAGTVLTRYWAELEPQAGQYN